MKTIHELDLLITKLESKKRQVSIAQIKEIRAIICDLIQDPRVLVLMLKAGIRRKR
jgi:6-phosphogluconate dehydrogenase